MALLETNSGRTRLALRAAPSRMCFARWPRTWAAAGGDHALPVRHPRWNSSPCSCGRRPSGSLEEPAGKPSERSRSSAFRDLGNLSAPSGWIHLHRSTRARLPGVPLFLISEPPVRVTNLKTSSLIFARTSSGASGL